MKKFLFIILLVCICFSSKEVFANDEFNIVWEKIDIEIPINANFNDYKDDYIVKVYVNNKLLIVDRDYHLILAGTGPSLNTVNTSKVGNYKININVRLFEYGSASSSNVITYQVRDNKGPDILFQEDTIKTPYGVTPDYNSYFELYDESGDDITVKAHDGHVTYKICGTYDVYIDLIDANNKVTQTKIEVIVVDELRPRISLIKPLIFNIGEEIKVEDYLYGYDDYDKEITNRIIIEPYQEDKLGKQNVYISLEDLAGNKIRTLFEIELVDKIAPEIEFYTNEPRVDIEEELNYELFKSYIRLVKDNCSILKIEDVIIDFSSVMQEIGQYEVIYSLTDENGNKLEKTLYIKVVQTTGPQITCTDIRVSVGEILPESIIKNYINVYDKYDNNAINTLTIDFSNVNLNTPGIYIVSVSACNSSGVFSYETLNVIVEGSTQFDIIKYIPIIAIAVAPLVYFGYQKYKKIKMAKYNE